MRSLILTNIAQSVRLQEGYGFLLVLLQRFGRAVLRGVEGTGRAQSEHVLELVKIYHLEGRKESRIEVKCEVGNGFSLCPNFQPGTGQV